MSILVCVITSFAGACLLALALTPPAARLAIRYGILDRPKPPVKTHASPTPYLGGIAIAVAVVLGALPVCVLVFDGGWKVWTFFGCICALCMLGAGDDIFSLGIGIRLCVQSCCAAVLTLAGFRIEVLPGWLAIPATLVWIVGITNAVNLLDILDGLAAGIVAVASAAFMALGLLAGQPFVACVSAAVGGAALGFLRYNRPPARVFMGDAGSYVLGLALAVLALESKYTVHNEVGLLAPLLILAVPLFELCLVTVLRMVQGKPVFRASRDHVALRLTAGGMSSVRAVLVLCAAGAVMGVAAIAITLVGTVAAAVIVFGALAFAAGAAYVLGSLDVD